jgi:hypothetical protein
VFVLDLDFERFFLIKEVCVRCMRRPLSAVLMYGSGPERSHGVGLILYPPLTSGPMNPVIIHVPCGSHICLSYVDGPSIARFDRDCQGVNPTSR